MVDNHILKISACARLIRVVVEGSPLGNISGYTLRTLEADGAELKMKNCVLSGARVPDSGCKFVRYSSFFAHYANARIMHPSPRDHASRYC
jgi:hypothetical protein